MAAPEHEVKMEVYSSIDDESQNQTGDNVEEKNEMIEVDEGKEDEDEESCDDQDELGDTDMGLTVKGWGDAGAETVVLASEFKGAAEHCDDDDDDERYSDEHEDDVDYDDYDDDDSDGDEKEMFNDDVDNLYDAYKSVLDSDSGELDPLDTSVLEDPYADLPPISEDDELGTGELSKSGEDSIGFEDTNAKTVRHAYSKNVPESSGVLGTDELLSKAHASATQEQSVSDSGELGTEELLEVSGGIVVTKGKVAELVETESDDVLTESGEDVNQKLDKTDCEFVASAESDSLVNDIDLDNQMKLELEEQSGDDVVGTGAMVRVKSQTTVTVETMVTETVSEEVTVVSEEVKTDAPDVQLDVVDSAAVDVQDGCDSCEGLAEVSVELPDVVPSVKNASSSEAAILPKDKETHQNMQEKKEESSSDPADLADSSTQEPRVEEKHVAQVTETLEESEVVTEESPPGGDGDVGEQSAMIDRDVEASADSQIMIEHAEQDGDESQKETPQPESDDQPETEHQSEGEQDIEAGDQLLDGTVEDRKCDSLHSEIDSDDGNIEATKQPEVQAETKYDSGCESEKSGQLVSHRSESEEDASSVSEASGSQQETGHVELEESKVESTKKYPEFINTCEEKLKVHYVSCYAKEAPIDWFHVPNKPSHRIFTNVNLMERNGRHHNQTLTFDLLKFQPGLRILIEGRAGMGKSTLVHRIAYDYGLGMLLPLQRFKLVFVLDVLKWSRDQELHDVILEQAVQADAWGVEADAIFEWMQNNPEDVIFFIDGLDEHPGFPADHTLLSLAQGKLYPNSTVVFTTQPNRVFEITDCCHKVYVIQKFTEKQVEDFIDNFVEGKDPRLDKLKLDVFSERNVSDFYRVPLHLALLCTLFHNDQIIDGDPMPSTLTELFDKVFVYTLRQLVADRRVDTQKELELSMFEDMAFVLTRLALSTLQEDMVSLSKSQLTSDHEIDDDLLDEFIQYGLLEKVICRDAYFFPYKLFQEFLAAKFIAIEYFSAANSGQIGVVQDMKHVRELFELCWACYADGYKYEDLCIFTSGLLNRDYNQFVEALCKQYGQAPDDSAREMCLNVACACISENAKNRGFISLVVDSLAPKGDLTLDFSSGEDADAPYLLGISHMLRADKLPKLSLVNYNSNDIDALRSVASALGDTDRLRSFEIDFTNLDPKVNGMPKTKDGAADYSLLKQFIKSLSMNASIRDLGFRLNVDMMSLQGVEIISGLFLNLMGDLRSLGVHVHFDNKSSYFQDCPVIKEKIQSYENLNILISRFSVFLQNNSMLEKLELNGCFLHRDALPELKNKIIDHRYLRAISLAGQKEGAPLHREGANALAEILLKKNFDEVALDLNSFLTNQPDKYSLRDNNRIKFDTVQFENELIVAKLLKAMQSNGKLKRVKFSCQQIDCDLLDHVADFVEECLSLSTLEISCEEMDDLFMLFLGCGVLCSATLEDLTLRGMFDSGGATFLLVESCVMSLSLKSVTLSGTFTQDCIDWLAVSLPNLNIQCRHPMTLNLQGQLQEGESDSALESIEQLKDCVLPLDLLLETDFK